MPRLAVSRPRFRVSLRGLALLLAVAGGTAVHSQEADAPAIPAEPAPAVSDRTPWRYIVIHHSATPSGNARSFDRMHRGKGWDGVAYHFVIDNGKGGPDGRLEVTHRWWD